MHLQLQSAYHRLQVVSLLRHSECFSASHTALPGPTSAPGWRTFAEILYSNNATAMSLIQPDQQQYWNQLYSSVLLTVLLRRALPKQMNSPQPYYPENMRFPLVFWLCFSRPPHLPLFNILAHASSTHHSLWLHLEQCPSLLPTSAGCSSLHSLSSAPLTQCHRCCSLCVLAETEKPGRLSCCEPAHLPTGHRRVQKWGSLLQPRTTCTWEFSWSMVLSAALLYHIHQCLEIHAPHKKECITSPSSFIQSLLTTTAADLLVKINTRSPRCICRSLWYCFWGE